MNPTRTLSTVLCALLALPVSSRATEVKPPTTQPATAPVVKERDPLKFSAEADENAKARRTVIEQEIRVSPDHAWSGQYYYGDGLGANVSLWLAPQAGFLYEWHGCLGLYDRNDGAVVVDEQKGTIQLRFELEGSRIDAEYLPIRWGERRYLVAKDQMEKFCEQVNMGREPRQRLHGWFFIRNGDETRPADGLPDVPEQYRARLTPKLESK